MSTGKFSCPWDSGQVGFIYCTMKRAREEWAGSDEEIRAKAVASLESEVQVYDDFLTGNVSDYVAETPDGETIDSGCGFFPDHGKRPERWDFPINLARAAVDYWCEEQEKERMEARYWAERDTITAKTE